MWIEHSLTFRGRDRLFLPAERWQAELWLAILRTTVAVGRGSRLPYFALRACAGVDAAGRATGPDVMRVDDELPSLHYQRPIRSTTLGGNLFRCPNNAHSPT